MSESFGQMLPFALVIALSPIPLVAVIAVLFSQRAVTNGTAFLAGWVIGVGGGLALRRRSGPRTATASSGNGSAPSGGTSASGKPSARNSRR